MNCTYVLDSGLSFSFYALSPSAPLGTDVGWQPLEADEGQWGVKSEDFSEESPSLSGSNAGTGAIDASSLPCKRVHCWRLRRAPTVLWPNTIQRRRQVPEPGNASASENRCTCPNKVHTCGTDICTNSQGPCWVGVIIFQDSITTLIQL